MSAPSPDPLPPLEALPHPDTLPPLDIRPLPPPNKPRDIMTWDQMSCGPSEIKYIEELRAILIVDGNFTKFKRRLDELLASTDQDFDIKSLGGSAFMLEAVRLDAAPFIEELLDRGVAISQGQVSEALRWKARDALTIFLWRGYDVNASVREDTPSLLCYAHEEMAVFLLENGADPNKQCLFDVTPLSFAAQTAPVHTVKFMLDDYDGDVRKGQLLHFAARREIDVVEVLELLLDRGAAINQTLYENHEFSRRWHFWMPLGTALHEAAQSGKVRAVRFLLSRGIDPSIKDNMGHTALDRARQFNREAVVKLLEEVEGQTTKTSEEVDDTPSEGNGEKEQVPARNPYCTVM